MAAPRIQVKIEMDTKKIAEAFKAISDNAPAVASALSGAAAGINQAIRQAAGVNINMDTIGAVVSRSEFKALADKYGRCAQRVSMLLSLISAEELKRVGLLASDAVVTDIDGFDRVMILDALDRKVDQFNQAHQRLTGQRKKVPDAGRLELSQEEMARVFAAKSAGISTEDIVKAIKENRATNKPVRF
jgi:predicted DNA repair protein MutK